MKKNTDIGVKLPGLYLVHQNIPGKKTEVLSFYEHLLFVPLRGEITLELKNSKYNLGEGKMLYLPPKTRHRFTSSQFQGERLIALIDPSYCSGKEKLSTSRPSVFPSNALMRELLFYILLNPKTKTQSSIVALLVDILDEQLVTGGITLCAFDIEQVESRVRDFRVMSALEYMKSSLARDISMSEVAKKAGLSLRSLNRLVCTETGLSPRNILIRYRVSRAQTLLLQKNSSVTEVAQEVGYHSMSQFSLVFRKVTGFLPSEWMLKYP